MDYDDTGKVSFDHIYDQPDPRAYFSTLRRLGYRIPQLASGYFRQLLADRASRYQRPATVLDIGCSYGINAALLRCGLTMDDMYRRYCDGDAPTVTTRALVARDTETVRSRDQFPGTRFIGLDSSLPALSYATQAGFLDDAVHGDLEADEPTPSQRQQFAAVDLIISTGCIGYVTGKTLSRVLDASDGRRPWMAHFVLRMFPFDPVADCLAGFGYETIGYERVFKQRRFASAQEQALVLDTLAEVGVDSRGLESDGWFYARLFLSCPRGEAGYVGRHLDFDLGDG
jgi:SAM-dependent methyltransferase